MQIFVVDNMPRKSKQQIVGKRWRATTDVNSEMLARVAHQAIVFPAFDTKNTYSTSETSVTKRRKLDIEDSHIEAKVIQQSAAAAPVAADDNLKTILKEIRIQLFKLREVLNCKDKFENLFPRNSAASNFLLNTVQQTE